MTTTDLIAVIGGFAALLGTVGALLAAFTDAPHAVRHRVEAPPRRRPGADVPTPAAPWRGSPLADTRPVRVADMPPLVVDSPPSARGRLPVQGLPVVRKPSCTLCRDGVDVIGPTCIWCGCRPVMQP